MALATQRLAVILQQPAVHENVRSAIKAVKQQRPNRDQITFAGLLDMEHQESRTLRKAGIKNPFKQAWEGQFAGQSVQVSDTLTDWLLANDIAIYFPYSEEFNEETNAGVAVTFFDLVNEDENDGLYVDVTGQNKVISAANSGSFSKVLVNDEYATQNPVFVLLPEEDYPASGSSINTTAIGAQGWLSNMDERELKQEDIVHTLIPKIRLTDHYRGILGGNDRIKFYIRTSKLGGIRRTGTTVELDLALDPINSTVFEISRTSTRKNRWTTVDFSALSDWDMHERDIFVSIASTHIVEKAGGEFGFSLNIGARIVTGEDGEADVAITMDENISIGGKLIIGNKEANRWSGMLTRREVFANINTDLGAGLANWDFGGPYTIRSGGKVRYFLRIITQNSTESLV
jgi:hypothetical protein